MESALNDNSYLLGYPQQHLHQYHAYPYQQQQQQHPHNMDANGDFRPSFYNPFEIKHRRRTSRAQLKVLEKSFLENPKPNATVRRILAQKLDMTPRGVQIWFQNRRAKAKLLRRKSGQDGNEEEDQGQDAAKESKQQQQDASPVLFTQFFNNLKTWDSNNARSLATAAAASCIFDNDSNDLLNGQQQTIKFPIHPLAPVIDQSNCSSSSSDEFGFMNLEDWRRKSCPALGTLAEQQQPFFQMDPTTITHTASLNRRMTAFDDADTKRHFVQPFPIMKSSNSECSTPRWNSTSSASSSSSSSQSPHNMDFYSINYSPMPQQLTPMLSTGSPVSSMDGGYYDSCLDLLMNCSPSNDK
ncbi:hypothetical protein G6F42_024815 [Rhizopus arrhizus]|nr:hypothetical protein G6F42_024815 [Rhizopus arrhizus]